ncbi:hypothetical protein B0T17DRAFT_507579 [Bombardia bombarda]|uniref:Zn(2)-C6 fungal-type domain-containing protein n=1 Tax=Bombardia bombarda TaxID=252184 RepID=A0AA39XC28_9PEZI|nr:hypothetical protein B0T17DRAFT_507579 [Bombardia bombarda]
MAGQTQTAALHPPPPLPPPPPPPPPPRRPRNATPRLRSSCNSCGSAKVKCDQGQPQCGRCTNLGLKCIYGMSRKFGRPPKRTRIDLPNPGPVLPPHLTSHSLPFGLDGGVGSPVTLEHHHNLADFDLSDTSLLGQWTGELDMLGLALGMHDSHVPEPSTSVNPLSLQMEEVRGSNTSSNVLAPHSCARESYEILADLICPGPNLHAPDTNSSTVTAHLDLVLHANRNAMARLSRLLQCSCAKSGHRVMIHASIISRILMWYQQAAGWARCRDIAHDISPESSPSPSPMPDPRTGTEMHSRTLSQTTGFVVSDVPASLGTFGIEDQKMQAAIRNHLVLHELKNMACLIDLFSSHLTTDSEHCFSGSHSMVNLHVSTTTWLRHEYHSTIDLLKAKGHGKLGDSSSP